jgi:hypothetical protein
MSCITRAERPTARSLRTLTERLVQEVIHDRCWVTTSAGVSLQKRRFAPNHPGGARQ